MQSVSCAQENASTQPDTFGHSRSSSLPSYKQERRVTFIRDQFTCQYCDDFPVPPTADHVQPRSRRGSSWSHNLVCACAECNGAKGPMLPQEWYARLVDQFNTTWSVSERLYRRISNLQTRFGTGGYQFQTALPLEAPPQASTHAVVKAHPVLGANVPGGKYNEFQSEFPFAERPLRAPRLAA